MNFQATHCAVASPDGAIASNCVAQHHEQMPRPGQKTCEPHSPTHQHDGHPTASPPGRLRRRHADPRESSDDAAAMFTPPIVRMAQHHRRIA